MSPPPRVSVAALHFASAVCWSAVLQSTVGCRPLMAPSGRRAWSLMARTAGCSKHRLSSVEHERAGEGLQHVEDAQFTSCNRPRMRDDERSEHTRSVPSVACVRAERNVPSARR